MTDSNNDACGVTIPADEYAALRADTRFPYTYSADLIRLVAGVAVSKTTKVRTIAAFVAVSLVLLGGYVSGMEWKRGMDAFFLYLFSILAFVGTWTFPFWGDVVGRRDHD